MRRDVVDGGPLVVTRRGLDTAAPTREDEEAAKARDTSGATALAGQWRRENCRRSTRRRRLRGSPDGKRRSGSAPVRGPESRSGSIVWLGEFEAPRRSGGGDQRRQRGEPFSAPGPDAAGELRSNPTGVRAARPRPIQRTVKDRGTAAPRTTPFNFPRPVLAGGTGPESSGGGRARGQVGYGFCPQNRTQPLFPLLRKLREAQDPPGRSCTPHSQRHNKHQYV